MYDAFAFRACPTPLLLVKRHINWGQGQRMCSWGGVFSLLINVYGE